MVTLTVEQLNSLTGLTILSEQQQYSGVTEYTSSDWYTIVVYSHEGTIKAIKAYTYEEVEYSR